MNDYGKSYFWIWIITSIFLGGLPMLANLLLCLVAGDLSWLSIFRVDDMVYYMVILNVTSMLSILTHRRLNELFTIVAFSVQLVILVLAVLILGFWSSLALNPPATQLFKEIQERVTITATLICAITLGLSIYIQLEVFSSKDSQRKELS